LSSVLFDSVREEAEKMTYDTWDATQILENTAYNFCVNGSKIIKLLPTCSNHILSCNMNWKSEDID
jgi:hypothetical protein